MKRHKRRPDLLALLAILIGLSVLVTGFTQESQRDTPAVHFSGR